MNDKPEWMQKLLDAIQKDEERLKEIRGSNPPASLPRYQTHEESEKIMEDWYYSRGERERESAGSYQRLLHLG